jgi:hypothetical protein
MTKRYLSNEVFQELFRPTRRAMSSEVRFKQIAAANDDALEITHVRPKIEHLDAPDGDAEHDEGAPRTEPPSTDA